MLFFVLGAPGRFSAWCEALIAEMAGGPDNPAPIVIANTLAGVALGALRRQSTRFVVSTPQPTGALRNALVAAGHHVVVALDEPRAALLELVLRQGMAIPDAVQRVASGCSAFGDAFEMPGALLLNSAHDLAGQEHAAALIAEHLGLSLDPGLCARLHATDHRESAGVSAEEATAWWSTLDRQDQETIVGALSPYFEPHGGGNVPITWTHDLFFHGENPAERLSGPVDITGRPHCLLQGPFIYLPPGAWNLSLSLIFSHAAADREYSVEIATDHPLASGNVRPNGFGDAAIDLAFDLPEATHDPVVIRINSLRAVFDGTLTITGATLARA